MDELLLRLLQESLAAWKVGGTAATGPDGSIIVKTAEHALSIARAPAGMPFRWQVELAGRRRGAGSVSGVLRVVRAVVDPTHKPVRLTITPLPLEAP